MSTRPPEARTLAVSRTIVRIREVDMVASGGTGAGERGSAFAEAVRLRRRDLGLRQDELAVLAGVSERFVYALENGKQSVQLDKVIAVLSALGLHLELHRGGAGGIAPGAGVAAR
jgi:HTH-type transcriptional regulator / antitoxin HipB